MNYDNQKNIINNNYAVQRNFDSIYDGLASPKYLSKDEALNTIQNLKKTYLTSFKVISHLAIIGIVKFNSGEAYIFNRKLNDNEKTGDTIYITCDDYEELMKCYVFHSEYINSNILDSLKKEYFNRGGSFFEEYHSFEDVMLHPERELRKKAFRNEIIYHIIKHGFREVGKNKWSNGNIIIRQINVQKINGNYHHCKSHLDLDLHLKYKIYLGSIFSKYAVSFNQLSEKYFCVPCQKNIEQRYCFIPFEILFINY